MRTCLWLPFVLCSLVAKLHGSDAADFDKLRESYKAAIARAVKPLHQAYLSQLYDLRDKYSRVANLESANAVQAEIDATYQELTSPSSGGAVLPATAGIGQEIRVSIPANSVNGYRIGPLKKGTVITLSYVAGLLKSDGKVASDRPDAETTERGEKTRLAISHGRYKTQAGPVLAVVPAGTAVKPFSFTLGDDVDNVVLRINEDGNKYDDNPGAVTYKLKITQ